MKLSERIVLSLYRIELHLYPGKFRRRYAPEMLEAAQLSYSESRSPLLFSLSLAIDGIVGATREHLRTATTSVPSMAVITMLLTFSLVAVSVFHQQILRRGADRAPQQIVSSLKAHASSIEEATILQAAAPAEIASPAWLESQSPFTAIYNAQGDVVSANATLHGALPQPPRGIFKRMRDSGLYKVTWQPESGIRVALVGEPAASGQFLVAGQSLIKAETRISRFDHILLWIWAMELFGMLLLYQVRRAKGTSLPS
ncbi:hypothetical protein [Acidobacterium sp. S8]|uniref:hypothetical protein n=1 Tax=Acidobacterium sp. S8 TaxID=1641854 RepID=UPI00131E3B08|nr:hypothetical protein [Acidobacterium sp. S8]